METISLFDHFGRYCLLGELGEKLGEMVVPIVNNKDVVEIDFTGVKFISTFIVAFASVVYHKAFLTDFPLKSSSGFMSLMCDIIRPTGLSNNLFLAYRVSVKHTYMYHTNPGYRKAIEEAAKNRARIDDEYM